MNTKEVKRSKSLPVREGFFVFKQVFPPALSIDGHPASRETALMYLHGALHLGLKSKKSPGCLEHPVICKAYRGLRITITMLLLFVLVRLLMQACNTNPDKEVKQNDLLIYFAVMLFVRVWPSIGIESIPKYLAQYLVVCRVPLKGITLGSRMLPSKPLHSFLSPRRAKKGSGKGVSPPLVSLQPSRRTVRRL